MTDHELSVTVSDFYYRELENTVRLLSSTDAHAATICMERALERSMLVTALYERFRRLGVGGRGGIEAMMIAEIFEGEVTTGEIKEWDDDLCRRLFQIQHSALLQLEEARVNA